MALATKQTKQQQMKTGLSAQFARAAMFGAAALGLSGCVSLPSYDFRRAPQPPVNVPPVYVPPQPVMPAPAVNLPAGVHTVSYYGTEMPGTILVDIAQHQLYHVQEGGRAHAYPIASPRDGASIPPMDNIVTRKAVNPTWTPTASMRERNPALPAQVRGGVPENPLGVRALYLGSTLFRIHGTNEPQSIGRNASSGCIRMHNEHVIHLYDRVPVGSVVRVYRHGPVPGVGPALRDTAPRPAMW
jgi:lipoprotein-anchoring transpeptidase ErfK/SrfK